MVPVNKETKEPHSEWTCYYCSRIATTIRQGAAVCWFHAEQLRKVGWA
jgi:hypothetical protein